MITKLIQFLIAALICVIIFYVMGWFVGGMILKIIGIIMALCLLVFAMRLFGIALLFILSLTIIGTGCQTVRVGQQKPVPSNFGDSDVKLKEFSESFQDIKNSNLSTEQKMEAILQKAKELEAME